MGPLETTSEDFISVPYITTRVINQCQKSEEKKYKRKRMGTYKQNKFSNSPSAHWNDKRQLLEHHIYV